MNVASGTECTGMTPTPPLGTDDAESYREIYDIPVEQRRKKLQLDADTE